MAVTPLELQTARQAIAAMARLYGGCVHALAAFTPKVADQVLHDALQGQPHGRALCRMLRNSAAPLRAQRIKRERPSARAA